MANTDTTIADKEIANYHIRHYYAKSLHDCPLANSVPLPYRDTRMNDAYEFTAQHNYFFIKIISRLIIHFKRKKNIDSSFLSNVKYYTFTLSVFKDKIIC